MDISATKKQLPSDSKDAPLGPGSTHDQATAAEQLAAAAQSAIAAKAASLGAAFTGAATSSVVPYAMSDADSDFQQSFENCTIYWSPATGAHEIHGDIRVKYLERDWGLGLPVTDESGTPDLVGRYNHFANDGSIYYTPNTGPKVVQGAVRDYWASQGWERSMLGYPVRDCFTPGDGELAGDFQNGVIWIGSIDGAPRGYSDAAAAPITSDQLQNIVWHQFDAQLHKSPRNVGLHPDKSLDGVTDYAWGLDQSVNRGVMMTLNGFHDNGLLPDTDFSAHITVDLAVPNDLSRGPNDDYVLGAKVINRGVQASGIDSSDVASGISSAIDSFANISVATISADAPLLSLKTLSDGSARLFFSPTIAGRLAVLKANSEIADLAAGD
jgi:hypothetical protein